MLASTSNNHAVEHPQTNVRPPDERSSLLPKRPVELNGEFWHDIRVIGPHDLQVLLGYAFPLMITYLLQMGLRITDTWFVGHLGATELAAASLGSMFCMVTGFAFSWGMISAMDTLSTQAFTGASSKPRIMGLILQRAMLIMTCMSVMISLLWLNAEHFLLLLGQKPELASMAQVYINIILLGLLPNLISGCLRKYIQAQGLMPATTYILGAAFFFNLFANWLYIRFLNLGFVGSPLAVMSTYYFIMFEMLFYVRFFTDVKYWGGWSREALQDWGSFLRLGFPAMLSVSTDWAFEVCVISAGVLGQTTLAAQSVVMSLNALLLMIPFALTTAVAVRTGHNLGAQKPSHARVTAWNAIWTACLIALANSMIFISLRFVYPGWFTDDEDVIELVVQLVPVVACVQFLMTCGMVCSGILNGSGKQKFVALINIVSYYFIGLPFGLRLAFYNNLGLEGIWWGVFCSTTLKFLGELWIIYKMDWNLECKVALERLRDKGSVASMPEIIDEIDDV